MKPRTKRELKPRLRFPQFRDAPGWKEQDVGEVFEVTRGQVLSMTLVQDEKTSDVPYPVYSSQTKNNGLSGYYSDYLYENAITWTTDGANAGDVNYRVGKFYCTNVCGVLINTDGHANPCVAALINNVSRKHVSYVGNPKLMNGVMAKISIPFPTIAEQQRIAQCLASLDELMAAQSQRLDVLKAHKKGLMEQLFPREDETIPRLRFPEFRNMPEWEKKMLMNVVKSVKTGKLDANAMVEDGEFRFYTCAKNYYRIDEYAFEGEALLIAGNGAYLGYIHQYAGKFNAYQRTYVLQDFDINVTFLKYFLDRNLPSRINLEKKDGNTPYIVLGTITEMPLLIPKDADEQQKIADCLSFFDELIDAQTQNLDAIKTHKRGLMQQLFPIPDEVEA